MTITNAFRDAVAAAREPRELSCGGVTRLVYDVSGIPGADRLPRALVALLENVVRRASTDEDAVKEASAVVEAGLGSILVVLLAAWLRPQSKPPGAQKP